VNEHSEHCQLNQIPIEGPQVARIRVYQSDFHVLEKFIRENHT